MISVRKYTITVSVDDQVLEVIEVFEVLETVEVLAHFVKLLLDEGRVGSEEIDSDLVRLSLVRVHIHHHYLMCGLGI